MRWRKIFITLVLALSVVLSTVALGWSISNLDNSNTIVFSLHIFFDIYAFILSARSIGQNNPAYHSESILHLTALLTLGCLLMGPAAILPRTPSPVISGVDEQDGVLLNLWYSLLAVYIIDCIACFTTPLGPPLHYPVSYIYSEKTVQSITNKDEENVCGVISMSFNIKYTHTIPSSTFTLDSSPWDLLLFSYTTKIVWLGNVAESLDIGDLPVVPANMRATVNFALMREAMRKVKMRIFSWTPKPGSGWLLGYRLVRLNYLGLIAELLLAAVSAVLFYAPPLFLQKLVAFLEVDPLRENKGWGWVYVIGIFGSNVISFLSVSIFSFFAPHFYSTFNQSPDSCGHWRPH